MGSTGDADRKRRHLSSLSPTAAAKKQPFLPLSEDKKLDTKVLQFQNQKLIQKLETQKVELNVLENKYSQLRQKQEPYDNNLTVINNSWGELVNDLEACSIRMKESLSHGPDVNHHLVEEDGASSAQEDAFLDRLLNTGATETSCASYSGSQMEVDRQTTGEKTRNILCNILSAVDCLWYLKDGLHAAALKALPEDGSFRQKACTDLEEEIKNLRLGIGDLHLKHKSLARELQRAQDSDAKNKAELKRLRGELEITVADLEESNCTLATLKSERDGVKGTFFPVLNPPGTNHISNDRARDKQKDLQDMESTLKLLTDQASSRLLEIKHLHEERIEILKQLSNLQNNLKSVKGISSSQASVLVKDQLAKAKADLVQYRTLFEKLQVEKDNLAWREREMHVKNDLVDVFHRYSLVTDSRIADLEMDIQRQIDERNMIQNKLEDASRDPGRKEIIAEFKALLSSFPEEMGSMQSQLSKYKETASSVHSLRADVQSLTQVLERKAKELEALSIRSAEQAVETRKLQAAVFDLKESDLELNLILEMHRREFTDSREVIEARNSECKAWAHVQSLKSSLDEHNLELRVKTAIEAESISQQRLAAAEAEIADLRLKLESSRREKSRLSDVLKSKHEENEAYLSEIETIGQAYDDMQTQNQHLLQQITERDDYNIKLVLEGVQGRQVRDAVQRDKQTVERAIQQANTSVDILEIKAARMEDQLKICSDQVHRLGEDRVHSSVALENVRKKLSDVRKSSQRLRDSLDESQPKVEKSRMGLAELHMELERERYEKKRVEEEIEVVRRKTSRLRAHIEGSSVLEKLRQELAQYKDILKCSICLERPKEVVITKCYHLFCNPCVRRIVETRHRKCPVCAASFGANDVKPVYI